VIEKAAIRHIPEGSDCYAVSNTEQALRISVRVGDVNNISLFYKNLYDHTSPFKQARMSLLISDSVAEIYEIIVSLPERRFKYYFELNGENETVYLGSNGAICAVPDCDSYFYYPCINSDDLLSLPFWAAGATIYQIWTDRFCDGDPSNNLPCTKDWGVLPDRQTYFGGDFAGIIQKLPYLKQLGVDILYLNPVFASPSYHKYDICDYETVETCFGGEKELGRLFKAAHKLGLRVILDGVFNHCSVQHPFFRDLMEKGESSPYCNWFFPYSFPVRKETCNYDTFAGMVPDMPRFNTANPAVQDYLIENTVMWTKKFSADGWRLDVCDEVSHTMLKQLRKQLTAVRPDILIVGEIWNHAGKWMQGDEVHAVTNYKYRQAMLKYFTGRCDAISFWHLLSHTRMQYKTPVWPYLININNSHDTARLCHSLKGDARLGLCALALEVMLDGMPLVYYGDEVFMDGKDDPDCRRAMDWGSVGGEFYNRAQELISARSEIKALRYGRMQLAYAQDRTLCFFRKTNDETLLCAINPSDKEVTLPLTANCLLLGEGKNSCMELLLPAKSYSLWEVYF